MAVESGDLGLVPEVIGERIVLAAINQVRDVGLWP